MSAQNIRRRVRDEEPLATTTPTINPKVSDSMTQTMLEGHRNHTEEQFFNPPKEKPKRKKNYEARKITRKAKKGNKQLAEESQESDVYREMGSGGEEAITDPYGNSLSVATPISTVAGSTSSDNRSTSLVAGQTDALHNELIAQLKQIHAHSAGTLGSLSIKLQRQINLLKDRRDIWEQLDELVEQLRQSMPESTLQSSDPEETGGQRSEKEVMLLYRIGILRAKLEAAI